MTRAFAITAMALAFGASAAMSASAPMPLRALSEQDQSATRETGCTCSFLSGRDTLIQMIGHEFMIRNAQGRQACRITDAEFGSFSDAKTTAHCGGLSLKVRRTGKVREHPEADSADGPASLTITRGDARRTVVGTWGCAC